VSTATIPSSTEEALDLAICALGFLADADATQLPADLVEAAVVGQPV
jgi:hypothetical protein